MKRQAQAEQMGVDYYTQDHYVFVFTNEDGKEEKFYEEAGSRLGGYYGADYDRDIMTRSDYLDQIAKERNCNRRVLFDDGKWSCTEECKERLLLILQANRDKDVKQIYKMVFVWERG